MSNPEEGRGVRVTHAPTRALDSQRYGAIWRLCPLPGADWGRVYALGTNECLLFQVHEPDELFHGRDQYDRECAISAPFQRLRNKKRPTKSRKPLFLMVVMGAIK
jgi:hypothetical protein